MLFQSVIRRAETAIENILDQAITRVLVALPLLVAAGFATAALSTYVNTRYGVQTGQLIMAGAFATIGVVAMLYVSVIGSAPAAGEGGEASRAAASEATGEADGDAAARALSDAERELLTTLLATAAPIAVPAVMRTLIRNLPLVVLILIVGFILTRSVTAQATSQDNDSGLAEEVSAA
ncbi:MAG TPA: hypothetical protein PKD49_15480 [Hyphomicrobium sp.]|nr:hypothetical protein [Hyphomicrobium sp.]